MMLVDVTLINSYHKPYADSTLNNMKKSELIEYVRMLEHNYNVAVSFNHQQAKNFEKMLDQKWIPVSERLPETTCRNLATTRHGIAFLAYYTGVDWRYTDTLTVVRDITHWMPLPELPKECE